jgi:hypothetical protein
MNKFFSVIVLFFSCFLIAASDPDCESSRSTAERAQEKSARIALNAVPIPEISYFQEKRTVAKWAERWDKPNVPAYVYLVCYGKILGYYVTDGKPASTRSYLMPEEVYYSQGAVLSTCDIDGTYGENNPGIRFFTAEGVAVEWAGDGSSYLYTDAPIDFGYEVPRLKKKSAKPEDGASK